MLLLTLALAAQATPPPVTQATAECDRPVYATDQLVCADPALRRLDERLRARVVSTPEQPISSPLRESREDWFRRSRRCAFELDQRACVQAAYGEVLTIEAVRGKQSLVIAGRCRLADGRAADYSESQGGAALVVNGRMISFGMADAPSWHPFLRFQRSGSKATFRDLAGKIQASCHVKH